MEGKIKIGEVAVCCVPANDENFWCRNTREVFLIHTNLGVFYNLGDYLVERGEWVIRVDGVSRGFNARCYIPSGDRLYCNIPETQSVDGLNK